jgi:predicted lipase
MKFLLVWLAKSWIFAASVRKIRSSIAKKYNLESRFKQNFETSHEVEWKDIKWAAKLSRYAYKQNTAIRETYKNFDDIYINEINEVKYILLTDHKNKKHYISVRGTTNSHNALQDINFLKDRSKRLDIYLHTGFHRTAEEMSVDIIRNLVTGYEVDLVGHSLGAAISIIVGWYIDYAKYDVGKCITFGQPKVTDSVGTRMMRDKIKILRVVNETDIVSLVPPTGTHINNRYAHLGTLIKLLPHGKYCFLEEPDSLNFGINSFWFFAAREGFSFYEVGKELPDHYLDSYQENIDAIIASNSDEEILWKNRLKYL